MPLQKPRRLSNAVFEVRIVPINLTSYSHFRKKEKKSKDFNIFNIFHKLYSIFLNTFSLRQDIFLYSSVRLEYIHDICTACFMLQRISPLFLSCFQKLTKIVTFLFLRDFQVILEAKTWKMNYSKSLHCYLICKLHGISFLEWFIEVHRSSSY